MTLLAPQPFVGPAPEAVMSRAGGENFPVASRILPRRTRERLLAIYGFARLTDELGDAHEGERTAALDWLEADLGRAFTGTPEHPLLVRLAPVLRECPALTPAPFLRLIEANRVDQRRTRYETWAELRAYCHLSADPVGELVLAAFDASSPARIELSDSICTALQLVEHCQDVAEDLRMGRVYLPREDLERFGCTEEDLRAAHAGPALREVLAFQTRRARELIADGLPLLAELRGRARFAVAAFAAGGSSALDAIEGAGYDVLAGPPKAGPGRRLLALARVLGGRA